MDTKYEEIFLSRKIKNLDHIECLGIYKSNITSTVSVVLPCFDSELTLPTAINAVIQQSLPKIEVHVVQDGNGAVNLPRDISKLRKHTLMINQGAYGARNHGLKHSTGDFITVHDADDWSHPQKLEMQVKALLDHPNAVASVSHWARCTTDMQFETRPDGTVVHRNVSSLMIRREVFERLGYWDRVSVNADTEYYHRILAAYGPDSIIEVLPGVPLALGRRHEGSLTMQPDTHWKTQFGGVRQEYIDAAFKWHKECAKTGNWYLPFAPKERPFPAPDLINRSVIELGDHVWPHIKGCQNELHNSQCILLCGHAAGNTQFGAERSLLDVAKAISAQGYQLVVTLPERNTNYIDQLKPYCSDIVLLPCPWRDDDEVWSTSVDAYNRLIAAFDVKLLHVNTVVNRAPLVAARQQKVSSVLHVRELLGWDDAIVRAIGLNVRNGKCVDELHPLYLADRLIANSTYTAKCITMQYPELHSKIYVVTNMVELSEYCITSTLFDENCIRVGLISSNLPKKGVYDFVAIAQAALLKYLPIRFVLIGPENEHTAQIAKNLPSNLQIAGYAETPAAALAQVDVLLNLSTFQESFGRTVAEAMLAAKPVIAYRWGALPELIENGVNGFLVHLGDIEGVCHRLALLCERSDLLIEFGEQGRLKAKTFFNFSRFQIELKQAYEGMISL